MSDPAGTVAQDRARRDAARTAFDTNLARVRTDLEARGIGGRIADRAGKEAKAVLDEALDIAAENKGIVAGTIAALVLWLLRVPIVGAIMELFDGDAAKVQPELLRGDDDETTQGASTSD